MKYIRKSRAWSQYRKQTYKEFTESIWFEQTSRWRRRFTTRLYEAKNLRKKSHLFSGRPTGGKPHS